MSTTRLVFLAMPQAAIAAIDSEISTLYPASDRPRKRNCTSSQRMTFTVSRRASRSPALPRFPIGPVQSVGPCQNFHSTPA